MLTYKTFGLSDLRRVGERAVADRRSVDAYEDWGVAS
jgi:hypothetical protein